MNTDKRLPNAKKAVVSRRKLTGYLLDLRHPLGRGKAIFFLKCGFTRERWNELADALLAHAQTASMIESQKTLYGVKYVLEGVLSTPNFTNPVVRSVWIIIHGNDKPQFVTSYPKGE